MSGVKYINRANRLCSICLILCLVCINLTGCGSKSYALAYDTDTNISAFRFESSDNEKVAEAFATDLCVVSGDTIIGQEVETGEQSYGSAILLDVNNKTTLYSKNAYVKLYPASMTKVLTALCALKYGNPEDILTASPNVKISESGAQLCGFEPGDTMTMDQALHGLLMYSGNDAAVIIAEHISGSVEEFAKLMNDEAKKIGATNSNFVNPHGLHDENHYTTAYDMYLIFNEAMKYELFNEIIHMSTYTTNYKNSAGEDKSISYDTTNAYLKEEVALPGTVTVLGGKTGTTNAAGANLVLLSKDSSGNPYISVVMKAADRDVMYAKTTSLLEDIVK